MEFENPFYWWIVNPGISFLLSLLFSFIAFIGVLLFLINLVFLSFDKRSRGKRVIGIIFSLIIIGFCLKWDLFLIFIGNIAGFLTKGIEDILMQAIYYWYIYNHDGVSNDLFFLFAQIFREKMRKLIS